MEWRGGGRSVGWERVDSSLCYDDRGYSPESTLSGGQVGKSEMYRRWANQLESKVQSEANTKVYKGRGRIYGAARGPGSSRDPVIAKSADGAMFDEVRSRSAKVGEVKASDGVVREGR